MVSFIEFFKVIYSERIFREKKSINPLINGKVLPEYKKESLI